MLISILVRGGITLMTILGCNFTVVWKERARTRAKISALAVICTSSFSIALPVSAEDWKLSLSADYESGKYGTGATTDSLYVPATLKRYFDRGDVSVTVPYVILRSNGSVIVINGLPFKTKKKAGPEITNSGLGDMIFKGSLYALKDDPLDLYLVGKIKFPTADRSNGLGSGEFDGTAGVELGKTLSSKWSIFTDVYYTSTGSPSGLDLQDLFSLDVGIADRLSRSLTGSIFYYEMTPLTRGNPDVREVAVTLEYKITNEEKIFGGGLVGLTTSSPDVGVSGGASIKF